MKKCLDLSSEITVKNLKTLLSKCKSSSTCKIKLAIDDDLSDDERQCNKLREMCYSLYQLLSSSFWCVEKIAKQEHEDQVYHIYYEDRLKGSANGGATALARDIDKMLRNYPQTMIQIDLEQDA